MSSLQDELLQMANDSDSGVRFQLALAIGRSNDSRATNTLATLLDREDAPTMQLAVLCGIGKNRWPLIRELLADEGRAKLRANFLEHTSKE